MRDMNVAVNVDVDADMAVEKYSNMLKVSLITRVSLIPLNSLSSIFTCPKGHIKAHAHIHVQYLINKQCFTHLLKVK